MIAVDGLTYVVLSLSVYLLAGMAMGSLVRDILCVYRGLKDRGD